MKDFVGRMWLWLKTNKVVVIIVAAILVVVVGFLMIILPNLTISSLTISLNESEARIIRYTPNGSQAVLQVGDSMGYAVTVNAGRLALTECSVNGETARLAGAKIVAQKTGTAQITCRGMMRKDIEASVFVEIVGAD